MLPPALGSRGDCRPLPPGDGSQAWSQKPTLRQGVNTPAHLEGDPRNTKKGDRTHFQAHSLWDSWGPVSPGTLRGVSGDSVPHSSRCARGCYPVPSILGQPCVGEEMLAASQEALGPPGWLRRARSRGCRPARLLRPRPRAPAAGVHALSRAEAVLPSAGWPEDPRFTDGEGALGLRTHGRHLARLRLPVFPTRLLRTGSKRLRAAVQAGPWLPPA